ncbi:MAG TPA: patatin-like phospholipase family protein, partial [Bacteroidia bacterium]|nr:patatin-like phospholipase family protein [Bacteroidia bacterium]
MARIREFVLKHPILGKIIFFFPVQLFLVQIKKNPVLIIFWLLLLGFVTGKLAARYGLSLLFVDPEYLGEVGFLSFFIVGFACGGFIMAYQISCYIHNAFRFPFLATVSRPFVKFCMNNIIIPGIFILVYAWQVLAFLRNEPISGTQVFLDISGFLLGNGVFILISLIYFFRAGKDLTQMFGINDQLKTHRVKRMILFRDPKLKQLSWKAIQPGQEARDWHVETYFISFFRIRRARPFGHYDKELLNRVFRQNHGRAVLYEIIVIITLLLFGLMRDNQYVMIPAAASVFLLFTLYLMFTGILNTWFRGWSTLITVLILLFFNWLVQFDLFGNRTKAYGLNYKVAPVEYSSAMINGFSLDQARYRTDSLNTIAMLEKWYAKNASAENPKPKMSIISCSGGGLRSTLWTFYTLRYLDSISGNKLMDQSTLICGSSGGMLGAAYYRELFLRDKRENKNDRYNMNYVHSVSSDLLNPVAFSVAVNDWFLPLRSFEYEGAHYSMNRAYAFEEAVHRNTSGWLNKPMVDYKEPEANAEIPMMILAPTIVNDGRKLLISPQGISYLTAGRNASSPDFNYTPDAIEFNRLFANHNADRLRFSSALRMSATFPYITPLTELPTEPVIEVFDAGMRDNVGTDNVLRFLYTFKDWLETHTSGVVIIQTRDKRKVREPDRNSGNTIMKSLSKPLASFYGNMFGVQDYGHDRELLAAGS